jgi:hypothetical protein
MVQLLVWKLHDKLFIQNVVSVDGCNRYSYPCAKYNAIMAQRDVEIRTSTPYGDERSVSSYQ